MGLSKKSDTAPMVTSSLRVRATKQRVFTAQKTYDKILAKRQGLCVIQPDSRLNKRHSLICTNIVVEIQAQRPFFLFVKNFKTKPTRIKIGQVMVHVMPHPTRNTDIPLAALLGVTEYIATEMDPPPLYFALPFHPGNAIISRGIIVG